MTTRLAAVSEERLELRWAAAVAFRISASADNHRPISSRRRWQVYMACFDRYARPRTSVPSVFPRMVLLRDRKTLRRTISCSARPFSDDQTRFRQTRQDYLTPHCLNLRTHEWQQIPFSSATAVTIQRFNVREAIPRY